MTDEEIKTVLEAHGAAWLMDQMDEHCQPSAVRAVAAAAAAKERVRCSVLTDDMLRYAMAAMGTGSPREADNLRTFWHFAMEARNTKDLTPR